MIYGFSINITPFKVAIKRLELWITKDIKTNINLATKNTGRWMVLSTSAGYKK